MPEKIFNWTDDSTTYDLRFSVVYAQKSRPHPQLVTPKVTLLVLNLPPLCNPNLSRPTRLPHTPNFFHLLRPNKCRAPTDSPLFTLVHAHLSLHPPCSPSPAHTTNLALPSSRQSTTVRQPCKKPVGKQQMRCVNYLGPVRAFPRPCALRSSNTITALDTVTPCDRRSLPAKKIRPRYRPLQCRVFRVQHGPARIAWLVLCLTTTRGPHRRRDPRHRRLVNGFLGTGGSRDWFNPQMRAVKLLRVPNGFLEASRSRDWSTHQMVAINLL